mmetsp:Transcript_79779/g.158040  ORF Transcript_79779/g.158040 Transcript_79779/m.158040 type:complete len:295 (-) Transcript_79779:2340-3224(-)
MRKPVITARACSSSKRPDLSATNSGAATFCAFCISVSSRAMLGGTSCSNCCAAARCLRSCTSRVSLPSSTWRCLNLACVLDTSATAAAPCKPWLFACFNKPARKSCADEVILQISPSTVTSSSQAFSASSGLNLASCSFASSPSMPFSFSAAASTHEILCSANRCPFALLRSEMRNSPCLRSVAEASNWSCKAPRSFKQGAACSPESRRASAVALLSNNLPLEAAFRARCNAVSQSAIACSTLSTGKSSSPTSAPWAVAKPCSASSTCCSCSVACATSNVDRTRSARPWAVPAA